MAHPSFPLPGKFSSHPYKEVIQNLIDIVTFSNFSSAENPGIFVIIEKGKKILLSYHFSFGEDSIAEAKARAMHKYILLAGHYDKKLQVFCAGTKVNREVEDCIEKILDIYFSNPDANTMRKAFRDSLKKEESELYQFVGKRFFKDIVVLD